MTKEERKEKEQWIIEQLQKMSREELEMVNRFLDELEKERSTEPAPVKAE